MRGTLVDDNQCPTRFVGIASRDLVLSKSGHLHVVFLHQFEAFSLESRIDG
jgi:hypothetical protein